MWGVGVGGSVRGRGVRACVWDGGVKGGGVCVCVSVCVCMC